MAPKAEKSHVNGVSFTSLALHLSMLIVGAQYNSEKHCKLQASEYIYDEFHLGGPLDTGHFFNTSLIQGLVYKGIVKGQESKVWAFFKGLRSFRGPQKQN